MRNDKLYTYKQVVDIKPWSKNKSKNDVPIVNIYVAGKLCCTLRNLPCYVTIHLSWLDTRCKLRCLYRLNQRH